MFDILVTIVTVFYVVVCLFMVLVILLQAGRGGMGTALGGGASQSVFGGGGSSDVLAKVTQWCAMSFMVFAMFLAYAGSHSGSSRLQEKSQENDTQQLEDADGEVNWEAIGPNPIDLTRYAAPTPPPAAEPIESPADAPAEPGNPADAPAAPAGDAAPAPADTPAAPAGDAKAADADAKAP